MTNANGATWNIAVGDVLRRVKVHEQFGGSRQSGIAPIRDSNNVLLFTRDSGKAFGYDFDGRQDDGSFLYTGEGRDGDQALTRGNLAITQSDAQLRLFESVDRTSVRYLGEYRTDPVQAYVVEQAPDRNNERRNVFVFKLWPIDVVPSPPVATATSAVIPLEKHTTKTSTKGAPKPTEAERREAALVQRYTAWIAARGVTLARNRIDLPDAVRPLLTDIFNPATGELIEAKGSAARDYIRQALGQLLDYGRFVEHQSKAVLLPALPAKDLVELLIAEHVACIYETAAGEFKRIDPTSPSTA